LFPSYSDLDRVIAVAVAAWCVIGATTHDQGPTTASASLEALAADVEAGRRATPLISEPASDGQTVVTFLARRVAGRAPRIVSDVTGWGEHVDGTFDSTVGRMTRVGRGDWYSLQARVAPRARIEYLIAYGRADYRLDPHNPRQVGPPPASEFVTPGYRPPQELVDPPASPAGLLTETIVESRALGRPCPVIIYTASGRRNGRDDPVAVFLDSRADQMSRVLDWLIAHQVIGPLVAVFVEASPPGPNARTARRCVRFSTRSCRPGWPRVTPSHGARANGRSSPSRTERRMRSTLPSARSTRLAGWAC
jgi:hypothetical protein